MHVRLMADVKDDFILRAVKYAVQRDSQLNDAQIGRKMSPLLRNGVNNDLPNLAGELIELINIQFFEIFRPGKP